MSEQRYVIGDCLDLLPSIPDKSIDLIITDLPYGTTCCAWDTCIDLDKLWPEYKRIIKDNGAIVLFGSQPFTSVLIMSNVEMFKYTLVWEKTRPSDFMNARNKPLKSHEDICIFSKGCCANNNINNMKYNPQGIITVNKKWSRPTIYNSEHNYDRPSTKLDRIIEFENYPRSVLKYSNGNNNTVHPTQKPVALFEYLIKTYTNEGDWVHDSCLGSGTTLEACMNTNRNCIGFEISDEWVGHYVKRLRLDNSKLTSWL
jgi:site-specific DNA-methyltransferase (adenine-specific)